MTDFSFSIRLATLDDHAALCAVETDVFDNAVKPQRAEEFLKDPRHHLVLAFAGNKIVGMASAFHYVHPDKDPTMFINEVGVATGFQLHGIGRALVRALCEHGKTLGCVEAWIGTEVSNIAAHRTYLGAGGKEGDEPFVIFEYDLADKKDLSKGEE